LYDELNNNNNNNNNNNRNWKMLWNGDKCRKIKVMTISRKPFSVKIMIDQKQLEKVELFKYLGSILTNVGRCTCEIKCSIAMENAAFNKKQGCFY
jgi:hypothetical protein